MDMKIILLLIILVIFWAAGYMLLRIRVNHAGKTMDYIEWIQSSLADMFYDFEIKKISRTLIAIVVAGGLAGFILPGKVSQIERKMSIERAISYNEDQEYGQAVMQLDGLRNIRSPLVHNELGVAYLGLNNFAQAEKELLEAVRILPQFGKAHQNLAELYNILGRYSEASFAETRARESQNFSISEDKLYNLPDNLTDQMGLRIFLAALFAFGAYNLPKALISLLKWRRAKQFDSQLADGLIMISNGLRAGLSLVQAIEMVAKEGKPPLSQEFELVLREHRLGASLGDSLRGLAERMPGNDIRIMVNATLILLESGGNLPERFDTLARTMQERKKVQQKIKTMTAEGVTQAWILALLPLVLALALNAMNNEVFRLMYTTILGWMVIGLVVLMEIVGIWWMLKIVRVKI